MLQGRRGDEDLSAILLLEDDESINRGITFILEKDGYQVYSCATVAQARSCRMGVDWIS